MVISVTSGMRGLMRLLKVRNCRTEGGRGVDDGIDVVCPRLDGRRVPKCVGGADVVVRMEVMFAPLAFGEQRDIAVDGMRSTLRRLPGRAGRLPRDRGLIPPHRGLWVTAILPQSNAEPFHLVMRGVGTAGPGGYSVPHGC